MFDLFGKLRIFCYFCDFCINSNNLKCLHFWIYFQTSCYFWKIEQKYCYVWIMKQNINIFDKATLFIKNKNAMTRDGQAKYTDTRNMFHYKKKLAEGQLYKYKASTQWQEIAGRSTQLPETWFFKNSNIFALWFKNNKNIQKNNIISKITNFLKNISNISKSLL